MLEYGHGDHLECVADLDDLTNFLLKDLLTNGVPEDSVLVHGIFFRDTSPSQQRVVAVSSSDPVLSVLAMICTNEAENVNEIVAVYPFVKQAENRSLRIKEILEWPNEFEATIRAATEDDIEISFFDTKYYKNKGIYEIGGSYDFRISALAYNAEVLVERSFSLAESSPLVAILRADHGPEFDEEGNVKPITVNLGGMVSLLSTGDHLEHNYEFQSPVGAVEEAELFGERFYALQITTSRDPDSSVRLFAKQSFFEERPKEGDPVCGVLWLQGYLAE